jgi:hypothetical protein
MNIAHNATGLKHSDSELIIRLAAELAKQLRPTLPIEIDLWDIATIATYVKRSESVVRERVCLTSRKRSDCRQPAQRGATLCTEPMTSFTGHVDTKTKIELMHLALFITIVAIDSCPAYYHDNLQRLIKAVQGSLYN